MEVEAIQVGSWNPGDVSDFAARTKNLKFDSAANQWLVKTEWDGTQRAIQGDWIVRDTESQPGITQYYVKNADKFEQNFEEIS